MFKIAVIVPAWNEEATLAMTLQAIRLQKLSNSVISQVIVVANNCTDATADIARGFSARTYRSPTVIDIPKCPGGKAGAMNIAYRLIVKSKSNVDFVFTMDADTTLMPGALQGLVDKFLSEPRAGTVCSRYHTRNRTGLVRRLQALDYARSDDRRDLKGYRVMVSSGAAVMYRREVLEEVVEYFGRGPWDEKSLIEDYALTLDIKKLGYTAHSTEHSMVLTDSPTTLRGVWKQRLRWGRGGVDEVRKRGWTPATKWDIMGYGLFLLSLATRFGTLALIVLMVYGHIPFRLSLPGFAVQTIMITNRITSTYTLRGKGWKDHILIYTVLLEDFFGFFLEAVTAASIWKSYRGKQQDW